MKNPFFYLKFLLSLTLFLSNNLKAQDTFRVTPFGAEGAVIGNLTHDIKLGTHYLTTDKNNNIPPWYLADVGESCDYVLNILWKFWDEMPYALCLRRHKILHDSPHTAFCCKKYYLL